MSWPCARRLPSGSGLAPGGDRHLRPRGQGADQRLDRGGSAASGRPRARARTGGRARRAPAPRARARPASRRDPDERPTVAVGPLAQQRRLAVAGGRADEDERDVGGLDQRADEAVAADGAAADAGAPARGGDGRRRRWEDEGRSGAHATSIPGSARRGEGARRRRPGRRTPAPGWCPRPAARLSSPCRSSRACDRSRAARPSGRGSRTRARCRRRACWRGCDRA